MRKERLNSITECEKISRKIAVTKTLISSKKEVETSWREYGNLFIYLFFFLKKQDEGREEKIEKGGLNLLSLPLLSQQPEV